MPEAEQLRSSLLEKGKALYRDLPWRNVDDPYAVLLSEIMLQQTQVSRVDGRWQHWLERFPTVQVLAKAPLSDVLEEWQGMGYNRRAINLQRCAQAIMDEFEGEVPSGQKELMSLPGVGPATAAGVRAFAFNLPGVYLETNVRAVFLHECFPDAENVSDKELIPLVEACCPPEGEVREWYYALLDYGAWLKKAFPNPSRKSKHHSRQSKFEGSHRQKRAFVLRLLLQSPMDAQAIAEALDAFEVGEGRGHVSPQELSDVLDELSKEGFIEFFEGAWRPCA